MSRLLLLLTLPAVLLAVCAGLMLGSFATGEAPPTRLAGFTPPDAGAAMRSADAADAVQPATVAYIPEDRYAEAAQRWGG